MYLFLILGFLVFSFPAYSNEVCPVNVDNDQTGSLQWNSSEFRSNDTFFPPGDHDMTIDATRYIKGIKIEVNTDVVGIYPYNNYQGLNYTSSSAHWTSAPYQAWSYNSGILPKTCPEHYQLDGVTGECNIVDQAACDASIVVEEVCADGLPLNLNGYFACDRPDLQLCADGSYIGVSSVCEDLPEPLCTDHDSCYELALSESTCASSSVFTFDYSSPGNSSSSCTTILADSADNPVNGGNSDGDINNDPSSDLVAAQVAADSSILSNSIDDSLSDDFSNVERAVREGDSTVASAITASNLNDNLNYSALKSSIEGSSENVVNAVGQGTDVLEQISSTLTDIKTELEAPDEEPVQDECSIDSTLLDCITPTFTSTGFSSVGEVNTEFFSRIQNGAFISSFSNIENIIAFEGSDCPAFGFDLTFPFMDQQYFSTTIHCDLMVNIAFVLFPLFKVVWLIAGFRIVATA